MKKKVIDMFKKIFVGLCIEFFAFSIEIHAQYSSTNMAGVKVGVAMTQIEELNTIFVSEDYYSNYSFTDHMMCSPSFALVYNYHDNDMIFGGEFNIQYYQLHTSTEYEDINTLNYIIDFKYHMVGAGAYIKIYPYKGLNFALGARFGICLTPNSITYESNQEESTFDRFNYPSVELTQGILQDKIKGKFDVGIGFQMGWEFESGFNVQAGYHYSVLDMIETLYNSYAWVEQDNNVHSFQLMLGYAIGIGRK